MHSHSHGHSHGGINEQADFLTNLGAFGEAIEGAANFFFGATVYNTLYELYQGHENKDKLGWPLYIGLALGTISLGSAYTHRLLDVYHQHVRDHHDHEHKHIAEIELKTQPNSLQEPLISSEHDIEAADHKKTVRPTLTGMQRLTLFGDATAHILGRAGLLSGMVDVIAMTFANTVLPAPTKALVLSSSAIFGSVTSASGIRTCWNTMLEQNQQKAVCNHVSSDDERRVGYQT